MERKKITFDSFIRGSIGCVLVVGILMLVERLSGVLLPFFIAWLNDQFCCLPVFVHSRAAPDPQGQ